MRPQPTEADIAEWRRLRDEGWTYPQIAALAGRSRKTVSRRLAEAPAPDRRRRDDITLADILHAVTTCGSYNRAAQFLGVSKTLIADRLAKHNGAT